MSKIDHSKSIWTTSVGKYWKSWRTAKIGHSESIQTTSVGKYWKSCKMAKIDHSESIQTIQLENIGKVTKQPKLTILNQFRPFSWKILEKSQNSQNWPF